MVRIYVSCDFINEDVCNVVSLHCGIFKSGWVRLMHAVKKHC